LGYFPLADDPGNSSQTEYYYLMTRPSLLLLLCSTVLTAQSIPARPSFVDYAAKQIYKGAPAAPRLDRDERTFRTVIRSGAKSEVQFAGHYTLPQFGCGAGCSGFYIVDSINGKVYDGFGIADLPGQWLEKQSGDELLRIQFFPSSRLLKINGCPNEHDCGYYDYVMEDGKGLKLIQKWLLPKEFQD
jgi:hypothetical protein